MGTATSNATSTAMSTAMSEVKFGSFADTQMWSDNELKYLKHVEQRWPDELTPTMIALIDAELKRREKHAAQK